MRVLPQLFEKNRAWSESLKAKDPEYFTKMADEQAPEYLWIGCADSRVPANEIVGLPAGDLFVHRNVANMVVHTDLNCLSVIQFAVQVLKVKHVIVCGHYNCGGVKASMGNQPLGLIENWLRHIKDVYSKNRQELEAIRDFDTRLSRMCELNVQEQVHHVSQIDVVQEAWAEGRDLAVHGWVYDLKSGLLKDLDICITGPEQVDRLYHFDFDK